MLAEVPQIAQKATREEAETIHIEVPPQKTDRQS
jgi:hypothetical protein